MTRRHVTDDTRLVDAALGVLLRRLDPSTPQAVAAAATGAARAVDAGHAALELPDVGGEALAEALCHSRWIDTPAAGAPSDPGRPLVFERGLLYLRRYREYERRLAAGLARLASSPGAADADAAGTGMLVQLFPDAAPDDRQAEAARRVLVQRLLLVTGGPGTGKTTTVARMLALLVAQRLAAGGAPPRIALAAPTGRAAERMAGSVREATARMRDAGVDPRVCDALPTDARTLHRLLGSRGHGPDFRHDADHPLQHDIVVVDEASMVDLPMMCKLVEAVPDGARLVLLGDPDQLPAVEAGDVLAAMVAASGDGDGDGVLRGRRVHLVRGYRASVGLQLAPLAEAVRTGDADVVLDLLKGGTLDGVHWHDGAEPLSVTALRQALLAPWQALAAASDPVEALRAAGRQRLLTALRVGPTGAAATNDAIEDALAGPRRDRYFHGRLLLVTENSYRHGLFNGDIGICLRDAAGGTVAWFAGSGADAVRGFHPAALPAHAGAFAMTVHKAQGSEFERAWVVLPAQDHPLVSRELLYTALTRAREVLHVCAPADVLRAALSRRVRRVSGLGWRLIAET